MHGGSVCRKSLYFKNRVNSVSPSPDPFPSGRGLLSGAAAPATLLGASPQTPFFVYKEVYRQSGAAVQCTAAFLYPSDITITKRSASADL